MKKQLFASLAALSTAATLAAQERPNIVVFLVDDMGLMDTSVPFITDRNGQPERQPLNDWYRTPNMERLAAQGTCFSTFYAQSVSSPSRTSIMTGQNAARHRTTNWINAESNNRDQFGPYEWNWQGLKADAQIYPAVLKAAGYKTIHVGKAHFGCKDSEGEDPTRLGFDVNIAGSSIGHPGSYHGENGYGWIKGQRARAVPDLEQYHGTSTFLSDALTLEAEKEIDKAIAEGKPFYLNMAHYAVHAPFETDERFIGHYQNSDKPQQAKAFATLIEGMDKSLGDLLDKLEEAGVAENTLVIFSSDNGPHEEGGADPEFFGRDGKLRGLKRQCYEGGIRIPFIVRWPGHVPAGTVNDHQLAFYDVMPTFCELIGDKKFPKKYLNKKLEGDCFDGISFAPTMLGQDDKQQKHAFLYWEFHETDQIGVRMGDWKLVVKKGKPHLYDLAADVHEDHDIAALHPDIVEQMIGVIHREHRPSELFKVTLP